MSLSKASKISVYLIVPLAILVFLQSCQHKKYRYYSNNPPVIEMSDSIMEANNIKSISEYVIFNDTFESPRFRRLDREIFVDKNGRVELMVRHRYLRSTIQGVLRTPGIDETPDPMPYRDSTFYSYDSRGFLISVKEYLGILGNDDTQTTTYTYDDQGNVTSWCSVSPDTPMWCIFSSYKYDKNNRIISQTDSADYVPDEDIFGTFRYKYDAKGRVVYDGTYEYHRDKEGRIVERFGQLWRAADNTKFLYDPSGNIAMTVRDEEATKFRFDDKGLLIEKKELVRGKVRKLFKYQYTER